MKILSLLTLFSFSLFAHEGPPYPILVDYHVEQHKLSIWADPDVGEGSFQFYLQDGKEIELNSIEIEIIPITPEGQIKPSVGAQRLAHDKLDALIPFESEGLWTLQFITKRNKEVLGQKEVKVEVTPPGPSELEFIIYLFPFIIIGFIWIKVLYYKSKR